MKLRELLQNMLEVQKKIGATNPYICGGTPRDKYLNRLDKISDIDITTGDKTCDYLSQEFAIDLQKKYNIQRKTMSDGHSSIFIGKLKIDFSSNFMATNIDNILHNRGIAKPTNMQRELFSRDFTCNSLLLSFDLKDVTDPTGYGFRDMKEKKIKTCLSPEITLTSNKNRAIRAIYLASKLNFDIDKSIIEYVSKHPEVINIASHNSFADKINDAFKWDADRAEYNISKMNIWNNITSFIIANNIPVYKQFYPYYIKHMKNNTKQAYFQGGGGVNKPTPKKKKYKSERAIVVQPRFKEPLFKNYDLYEVEGVDGPAKHGPGAGFYQNMDKYKSVSDFLSKKRKRNKHKYKSDDSYIEDDGSITKGQKKNNKMARRMMLLSSLVKTAIDFPIDDQINSSPILGDSGAYGNSIPIGGQLDEYLTMPDFERKSPDKLDFGRDYDSEEGEAAIDNINALQSLLDELIGTLNPREPDLYGLPDGISPKEDLDAPNDEDPEYGTTDSGNTLYDKMWI